MHRLCRRPGPDPYSTTPNGSAAPTSLLAGIRNGAWLDAQTFPPLAYAVDGLLAEGFTVLAGPPKAGKSLFVLDCLLAIAGGGYALGALPVGDPRPVLYLALEDGDRRLQARCRELLRGEPIPPLLQLLTRVQPGMLVRTVAEWLAIHGHCRPLVVIDTLGKVMPPGRQGQTTYERDYEVGGWLKRLADDHPGTTVLVNHHDRKATSEDFVQSVSGTQGITGSADSVVLLARRRGEGDAVLHVTGRDVAEAEYAVTLNYPQWMLDGVDLAEAAQRAREAKASEGLGDRSAEVVAIVNAHPDGIAPSDVAPMLGIDSKTAGTYLGRLMDAGRIRKLGRGRYAPCTRVESVESVESGGDGTH